MKVQVDFRFGTGKTVVESWTVHQRVQPGFVQRPLRNSPPQYARMGKIRRCIGRNCILVYLKHIHVYIYIYFIFIESVKVESGSIGMAF